MQGRWTPRGTTIAYFSKMPNAHHTDPLTAVFSGSAGGGLRHPVLFCFHHMQTLSYSPWLLTHSVNRYALIIPQPGLFSTRTASARHLLHPTAAADMSGDQRTEHKRSPPEEQLHIRTDGKPADQQRACRQKDNGKYRKNQQCPETELPFPVFEIA